MARPASGPLRLGDRDGPVQLDDRRAGEAGELAVERGDLGPVARLVGVQGRDRRLHDVGAAAAQGEGPVEHRPPLGDLAGVPERAVLVGEQHQLAVAEARLAAGVVQQHHRQQAVHLGLVGHQLGERPPEPERLGRQLAAAAVALVEDQVDDREHGGEPIGQQVVGRHPERDPGGLDLALGPHQPLRHRRLGDQEGAGDLVGRQAAERAQGERDLRVEWRAPDGSR